MVFEESVFRNFDSLGLRCGLLLAPRASLFRPLGNPIIDFSAEWRTRSLTFHTVLVQKLDPGQPDHRLFRQSGNPIIDFSQFWNIIINVFILHVFFLAVVALWGASAPPPGPKKYAFT